MTDNTFQRLIDKCRMCDETGCWVWTGGMGGTYKTTPVFHFPGTRLNRRSMPAYKAAWVLSGKTIPDGHIVYRGCQNMRCVNPDHCKAGTRKMAGAHVRRSGKQKGNPKRVVANMTNAMKYLTPEPIVRRIEELLGAGVTNKAVGLMLGISKSTVTEINKGRHFYCSTRPRVVKGASVFAL